jgi:hypothetical protein
VHSLTSPIGSAADVLTPPAAWTTINNAAGTGLFYRAFQKGDPTTGITFTSRRTDWFISPCIAYTGLDTSAPIDANTSFYEVGKSRTGAMIGYYAREQRGTVYTGPFSDPKLAGVAMSHPHPLDANGPKMPANRAADQAGRQPKYGPSDSDFGNLPSNAKGVIIDPKYAWLYYPNTKSTNNIVGGRMHVPVMKRAQMDRNESEVSAARPIGRLQRVVRLGALVFATICLASAMVWPPSAASHRSRVLMRSAVLTPCVTPSVNMTDYLDTVVVSTDIDIGVGQRQTLQLPAGPLSMVSAVTDSATCHRAAIAAGLALKKPDSTAVPSVSVVRVGPTRYVVTDAFHHFGEYNLSYTFDSAFTLPPLAEWGS